MKNKIRKVLKESDSFVSENDENKNHGAGENPESSGGHLLGSDRPQLIGGPAAVALRKKKILKSFRLSSFLRMYHQYIRQKSQLKESEYNEGYTPESKSMNDNTVKLRRDLVRTSYYGKRNSDYYLEDEENEESELNFNINVLGDLLLLWEVFKLEVSINFMTLVVKIALNLWESKIASWIVADFKANLSENMIERALKTDQMDFIYTVWSYRK